MLAPMAAKAEVKTVAASSGEPLRAAIDEDSLQQVVTNLVVNGFQAMPAGGTLEVQTRRVTATRPGGEAGPAAACVRVDVGDTGSGIPSETLEHVFEPFFTTKGPGDGTGLGLAIVHGIVDDHRGWISIATGAAGTTVSVFLQEASA